MLPVAYDCQIDAVLTAAYDKFTFLPVLANYRIDPDFVQYLSRQGICDTSRRPKDDHSPRRQTMVSYLIVRRSYIAFTMVAAV